MFAPDFPDKFRYATIPDIRDEGLNATDLPDDRALRLIELASKVVNRVTGQWFQPIIDKFLVDGKGQPIIHHRTLIPIIKVNLITLVTKGISDRFVLNDESFQIGESGRSIEIVDIFDSTGGVTAKLFSEVFEDVFPDSTRNVEVDAVLGWIEGHKEVETTIAADLVSDATTIDVADATNIFAGDFINFSDTITPDSKNREGVIITDVTSNTLTFDSIGKRKTIPDGSQAVVYGRVPDLINLAVRQLVINRQFQMNSEDAAAQALDARLKRERTDNYEYELFSADKGGSSQTLTGDEFVDAILDEFKPPLYLGVA